MSAAPSRPVDQPPPGRPTGDPSGGSTGVVGRARAALGRLLEWWKDSRAGRTVAWYGARGGALLSGGIAYSALFSLFAGLTIGWSVFTAVIGARSELRDAVLEQVDLWIPGLIDTGPGARGVLSPEDLVFEGGVRPESVVAAVVLVVSATGVMAALRTSVRAMFDVPAGDGNVLVARLWQLLGFALLGLGIVASAVASIATQAVGGVVESLLGGSRAVGLLVAAGAALVGVVIDALVVAGVVVVVGGVRPPRKDLVIGCLAAGLVSGTLRLLGTSVVVGSARNNAILASVATVATVLVLVNFVARVLLLVCAWMYDPARLDEVKHAEDELAAQRHAAEIDRIVRQGQGHGLPWSPVVRGIRRAALPR